MSNERARGYLPGMKTSGARGVSNGGLGTKTDGGCFNGNDSGLCGGDGCSKGCVSGRKEGGGLGCGSLVSVESLLVGCWLVVVVGVGMVI